MAGLKSSKMESIKKKLMNKAGKKKAPYEPDYNYPTGNIPGNGKDPAMKGKKPKKMK